MIAWIALMGSAAAQCLALAGASVQQVDGTLVEGQVVVVDRDLIRAISSSAPPDCERRELSGVLTPALVESNAHIGLVEVGLESGTRDMDAGGDPVRAAFDVLDAYNPRSTLVPIARAWGIGSTLAVPSGGLVSGQSAWFDMVGDTQAEALVAPRVAMHASIATGGDGSRAERLLALRELLDDARVYGKRRGDFEVNRSRDFAAGRLDLEALQPVVAGEMPLVIAANRASDIEALLRLVDEQGVRLVLIGAAEGWMLAPQLAEQGVAVMVNPMVYGPGGFDQVYGRADNAALLAAAGVEVIIASRSAHNARKVRQLAGNAVRGGLPHEDALVAITTAPHRAFGIQARGAIAPGQMANLVLWDGDPLELSSGVAAMWLRGVEQDGVSRQSALLEKYRALP